LFSMKEEERNLLKALRDIPRPSDLLLDAEDIMGDEGLHDVLKAVDLAQEVQTTEHDE